MPKVAVRKADGKDLPRINLIEKQFGKDACTPGVFKRYLREGRFFKVLTVDDEIAGYVVVFVRGKVARLYSICLDESYHGQGFGKFFLAAVEKELKHGGYRSIFLECSLDNKKALKLYQAFGYVETVLLPGYYENSDGVRMVKDFQNNTNRLSH